MESIMQVEHVTRRFGSGDTEVVAVRDISLSVEPGEVILIMGPSGSGKTTLLSMLGGLLKPSDGRIRVAGDDITQLDEKLLPDVRLRHIGFIFQDFNLLSALNILDNVALVAQLSGLSRRKARQQARDLLDRLGLAQYASYYHNAITSTDMTTRANSALLLGKSGSTNALRLLYWALEDRDSDDRVLLQAIESIAKLGDERVYQKLWTKLISAYADDRIYGIRAMGELGTEPAKQALHTMLEDPVLEVRLAAAEQLGRLNDHAGQDLVQDAFKPAPERTETDQVRIRVMAALAIGEIGTESLARQLPSLLNDRSTFVRISAAKAVFRQKMK